MTGNSPVEVLPTHSAALFAAAVKRAVELLRARRSRRVADRNGLWPRRKRAGRERRREDLRDQGPARPQSHHRPRRQCRDGETLRDSLARDGGRNSREHSGPGR